MSKRHAVITQDEIVRTLNAVRKAGIDINTIRVEKDGAIVINGDRPNVRDGKIDKKPEIIL